jgi:hypothetical protein
LISGGSVTTEENVVSLSKMEWNQPSNEGAFVILTGYGEGCGKTGQEDRTATVFPQKKY